MFSVVALAALISVGIVLVVIFAAKLFCPRLTLDSFHIVLAALVVLFSTVATSFGLINLRSKRALEENVGKPVGYVKELMVKLQATSPVFSLFNSRVARLIDSLPDTVDSVVDSRLAPVRKKFDRAMWLHFSILALINILFFIVLLSAGRKSSRLSYDDGLSDDDLDGFSPSGTWHSFDDIDFS